MPFPVDIQYIRQTEEKLGVTFPASFKLRMLKSNGGDVRTRVGGWEEYWQLHPFFDTSDKTRLKRTCNDIIRETKSAKNWPDFPPDAVAIGFNGGGDLLILLPDPGEATRLRDAIFWWDHETGEIEKVADDFDELDWLEASVAQMQDWYIEKRKAIEELFVTSEPKLDEAKIMMSPSGRYILEVIPHSRGPKSWGFSKGIVRHAETQHLITEIKRNYGNFPYSWAEDHSSGHDYLICGEDYQGQTIIELDTGKRVDYIPDAAEQGFGFCWTAHYPSPDGRFIFVDGCIWAGPYELVRYDFTDPMGLPYKELNRWPVWEVDGFQPDGSFIWEHNAEIRITDGKRVDEMTEEEEEEFEDDENYAKIVGERTIRMRWNPDGSDEIIAEIDKSE